MKKALTIVALSLVGILVITTIVLGFVTTSFEQVTISDAISVTVHKGTSTQIYYKDTDSDDYNKFVEMYNKQSKQSILKSLFTGAFSEKAEVINETTNNFSSKLTSGYWLIYNFDNEQILKIDGKEYVDKTQTTTTQVTYKKLAIYVVDTEDMDLVTMYIFDSKSSTSATHTIKVYADLSETYNYINDLEIV